MLLPPVSAAEDWLYSVRPGDTLWGLCKTYTHRPDCWQKLGPYNGVTLPRQLPPGYLIRFPAAWLKTAESPAIITSVSGAVSYRSDNGPEKTAAAGQTLPVGAVLKTGPDSIANLLFTDGTQTQVEPDSQFRIENYQRGTTQQPYLFRSHIERGSAQSRVPERQPKSRFEIRTPAAIAAVRGTEFRVASWQDNNNTWQMRGEVYDGAVAVAADESSDPVLVPSGFGVAAESGQGVSDPAKLLPAPAWTNPKHLQRPPIQASWQSLPAIGVYRVEVYAVEKSGEVGALLAIEQLEQSQFLDRQLRVTQGCVQLQVRGMDLNGLLGNASQQEVCVAEQLAAPKVGRVTVEDRGQLAQIVWPEVQQASAYQIEVSADAEFSGASQSFRVTTNSAVIPLAEWEADTLYYRVQALSDGYVASDYSQVGEIERDSQPLLALALWGLLWILVSAL